MGDHTINIASNGKEKAKFTQFLLNDIECLEFMLKENMIEQRPMRIGAEQEFCIVDKNWTPSSKALEILELIDDEHFTTELALYNLEINLDPIELKGDCFRELMKSQLELLTKAHEACDKINAKVVLAGILPSISSRHIESEYMTPSPRYYVLNEIMKKIKGSDFRLQIIGADELTMLHDSVLFEACNTSYQMHLQIEPDDFVSSYNWSQAIAGPLLSISTNSPILLGKELWSETRIALFQQSIDTRRVTNSTRHNEPRVTFGNHWISNSVTDIYKDDIARFQQIICKDIEKTSSEILDSGDIPKLEALSLHNGTIYRWNRACYGVGGGKPHLRIENRYIPSGPTVIDEIANMVFWIGLMKGRPQEFDDIHEKMEFIDAKSNFIKAARTGKDSHMCWMGESIPSSQLVLETLIPIAIEGLNKTGINKEDITLFMKIIEDRTKGLSGSEWQTRNHRILKKRLKSDIAVRVLCSEMYNYQKLNIPVSEWKDVNLDGIFDSDKKAQFVYEIMTTELFTVQEEDPADLVTNMMKWKNIHHVPVENKENQLVGILTWRIMEKHLSDSSGHLLSVGDIMVDSVISTSKKATIKEAEELMIMHSIGCLPVERENKLIGIITKKDLVY